jgi:hypothetical protein
VNVAVTAFAALIVTVQVPVPGHPASLQPVKVEPVEGVAVSVTIIPWSYDSLQSPPQSIPAGLLVTPPEPLPPFVTVRSHTFVNVAVTVLSELIVTMQVPVPGQPASLQPANLEPAAAVAVRVTTVPSA